MAGMLGCFVCRSEEANIMETADSTLNHIVDCPACGIFKVTNDAIKFYLNRDDLLNEEDRAKLSKYIKENVNSNFVFTTDMIRKVTGKISMHFNF